MNKIYLAVAVMFGLVSGVVFADQSDSSKTDQVKVADESKKPLVVRIGNIKYDGKEFKISPDDFPNGVYVSTRMKFLFRDPVRFEKVEEIIAKKMQEYGFKIASSHESSSGTLFFNGYKFAEINKGETDKLSRGLSIADNVLGAVLGGKLMGTQYVLTNGVNLQLDYKDVALSVYYTRQSQGEQYKDIAGVLDEKSTVFARAEYSEDNYVVSTILLDKLLDEWAKQHISTNKSSNDQPASSVAVTENK